MHLKGGANLLNQSFLLLARPLYGPSLVFRSRYRRRLAARLLPVLPPRPQGNRRTSSPISSLMSDESTFSCPCGWNPSQMPLALLSVWRQRHWRNCHGKPQPRLTPEGWSHFAKTRPRHDDFKAATAQYFARYHAWRISLPSEANVHVCEVFLNVLF